MSNRPQKLKALLQLSQGTGGITPDGNPGGRQHPATVHQLLVKASSRQPVYLTSPASSNVARKFYCRCSIKIWPMRKLKAACSRPAWTTRQKNLPSRHYSMHICFLPSNLSATRTTAIVRYCHRARSCGETVFPTVCRCRVGFHSLHRSRFETGTGDPPTDNAASEELLSPRMILLENHGLITLGRSIETMLSAMLMAEKAGGNIRRGGARRTKFMTPKNIAHHSGQPDGLRRKILACEPIYQPMKKIQTWKNLSRSPKNVTPNSAWTWTTR